MNKEEELLEESGEGDDSLRLVIPLSMCSFAQNRLCLPYWLLRTEGTNRQREKACTTTCRAAECGGFLFLFDEYGFEGSLCVCKYARFWRSDSFRL